MNTLVITILLIFLATFSLLTVNFVNRRELRRKLIAQKITLLRRRIAELEEMAACIEPLLESTQIPRAINDEIIHLLETIIQLDNRNTYMETTLDSAKALSEDLSLEKRSCQLMRNLSSDSQVARCKFQLNEAAKLIRKNQQTGRIEALEGDAFILELSWGLMMIEVVTYVNQGHVSLKQNDHLKAYGYYKHAQQVLIASSHPDERRQRLIKEVSDMLGNRRRALSLDLMPESANNPTADTSAPTDSEPAVEATPPTEPEPTDTPPPP
ncbi:hypothetical protein [Marinagarivorans algicola]|uniref:hypothetical protein n=1 Tax=Marinagarivorans algicola TaxID=1513270 RepID=UPI0006B91B6F|nr:hypothetical protein [Marinagarivorans algicola]